MCHPLLPSGLGAHQVDLLGLLFVEGLGKFWPHPEPVIGEKLPTSHDLLGERFDWRTVLERDRAFARRHLCDKRRRHVEVLREPDSASALAV